MRLPGGTRIPILIRSPISATTRSWRVPPSGQKFDSIFLADGLATWNRAAHSIIGGLEPFTFLSAVGAVTEKIGLIGTVSTTYNEPFHVARKFASLDHISNGRAGWNIVTSGSELEAQNFNKEEHLQHHLRYERAKEFVEITTSLWDSWGDDARIVDKETGIYAKNLCKNGIRSLAFSM